MPTAQLYLIPIRNKKKVDWIWLIIFFLVIYVIKKDLFCFSNGRKTLLNKYVFMLYLTKE